MQSPQLCSPSPINYQYHSSCISKSYTKRPLLLLSKHSARTSKVTNRSGFTGNISDFDPEEQSVPVPFQRSRHQHQQRVEFSTTRNPTQFVTARVFIIIAQWTFRLKVSLPGFSVCRIRSVHPDFIKSANSHLVHSQLKINSQYFVQNS
jgi:hypothetical protein